jgi:hypothetical protein
MHSRSISFIPVGALTSKPYTFTGRPWELNSKIFLDFFDPFGNFIKVESRFNKIMRILPVSSDVGFVWITDKSRYFFDLIDLNRSISPSYSFSKFLDIPVSFSYLSIFFSNMLSHSYSNNVSLLDFGSLLDRRFYRGFKKYSALYFNFSSSLISQYSNFRDRVVFAVSDFIKFSEFKLFYDIFLDSTLFRNFNFFFVFTNLRFENPNLNLQIRKLIASSAIKVFIIGFLPVLSYYKFTFLGSSFSILAKLLAGKFNISRNLNNSVFIFGNIFLTNKFKNFSNFYLSFSKIISKYLVNFVSVVLPKMISDFSEVEINFNSYDFDFFNQKFYNYFFFDFYKNRNFKFFNTSLRQNIYELGLSEDFFINLFPKSVSFNSHKCYQSIHSKDINRNSMIHKFNFLISSPFESFTTFRQFNGSIFENSGMLVSKVSSSNSLVSSLAYLFDFQIPLVKRYKYINNKYITNNLCLAYFQFISKNDVFSTYSSFFAVPFAQSRQFCDKLDFGITTFYYYSNFEFFNYSTNYYISEYFIRNSLYLNLGFNRSVIKNGNFI